MCVISADTATVWKYLTDADLVTSWMSDDAELVITSNWKQGGPIKIQGNLNGDPFVNEGIITRLDPEKLLRYEYQNSISLKHYGVEKHDVVEFRLTPGGSGTNLQLFCETGYTEIEEKHLRLYWGATLNLLKQKVEAR